MWPFNKVWEWRQKKVNQLDREAELETKLSDRKREMLEFLTQQKNEYKHRLEILDFKTELRQRKL